MKILLTGASEQTREAVAAALKEEDSLAGVCIQVSTYAEICIEFPRVRPFQSNASTSYIRLVCLVAGDPSEYAPLHDADTPYYFVAAVGEDGPLSTGQIVSGILQTLERFPFGSLAG